MKEKIHPEYKEVTIGCACGEVVRTRSTKGDANAVEKWESWAGAVQDDVNGAIDAACAAAILQHFEKRGIEIFADYRYYPNQLIYNQIFDALERYSHAE